MFPDTNTHFLPPSLSLSLLCYTSSDLTMKPETSTSVSGGRFLAPVDLDATFVQEGRLSLRRDGSVAKVGSLWVQSEDRMSFPSLPYT